MADVISWPGDLSTLGRVADLLRSGRLIGLPTEGGFEAITSALSENGVNRLADLAETNTTPAVVLSSPLEVFDWVPHLRGAGVRLARDYWPGAFVLVSRLGLPYGLFPRLPESVRRRLEHAEGLALRLTPRDDLRDLFAAVGGPLAIASLDPAATDEVDAILGVGPIGPAVSTTIAAASERQVRVLREGAIRQVDLEASGRSKVVFVCTGNTCRSPMAGVLCRRLLADTLGVPVSELAANGYEVESAGMAAANGEPASPEAVVVAQSFGADLGGHASQQLTMELVDRADHLFTMTAGHLRMLQGLRLPIGPEPQMLSGWGEDVPDPIGGPLELYQACAEQIRQSLRERLPQILEG